MSEENGDFDAETIRLFEIFSPKYVSERRSVSENRKRFVHYTSATTALSIIEKSELWFRNAVVMNDFREIEYGVNAIRTVFSSDVGRQFEIALNQIDIKAFSEVAAAFNAWEHDRRYETYLSCISVHDESEDEHGRLSMWRAYGSIALVLNNAPMMATTDTLGVFSTPVLYFSEKQLSDHLYDVIGKMIREMEFLQSVSLEKIKAHLSTLLFSLVVSMKHPGFLEEREWRIFYRPNEQLSPAMTEDTVTIHGTPQKIFKLSLKHEPDQGLFHADIPTLLDRVIIGPCKHPYVLVQAFVSALKKAGVTNAEKKVFVSGIPLRM